MNIDALDVSRLFSVILTVAGFAPSIMLIRDGRMTFGQAAMYHVWLIHTFAFSLYTFLSLTCGLAPAMDMNSATLWSSLLRSHGVIMAAGYALLLLIERREWRERDG